MVGAMTSVAKMGMELTVEERNLLSVAFKNVIGARRASWRIISSIEQKEESKGMTTEMTKQYRQTVSIYFLSTKLSTTLFSIVFGQHDCCSLNFLVPALLFIITEDSTDCRIVFLRSRNAFCSDE